jgi:hypothetical protein
VVFIEILKIIRPNLLVLLLLKEYPQSGCMNLTVVGPGKCKKKMQERKINI